MALSSPSVGDVVQAVRDGGHDASGLPFQRPVAGKLYRITGIYEMRYGLGCTLQGMNPAPYRGYFLYVSPGIMRGVHPGWYFKKVDVADQEFTVSLREYLESKSHEFVRHK